MPTAQSTKAVSGSAGLSYDRLMNANRGVGAQVANKLVGQTQQAANKANTATAQATSSFNTDVSKGFNNDAATYSGPSDPGTYFNAAAQYATTADTRARGLGTVQGRQAQLGGSMLDSLLAGREGGRSLRAASKLGPQAGQNLATQYTAAGTNAANTQTAADTLAKTRSDAAAVATAQANQDAQTQAQTLQQLNNEAVVHDQYNRAVGGNAYGKYFHSPLTYEQFQQLSPDEQADLAASPGDSLRMLMTKRRHGF